MKKLTAISLVILLLTGAGGVAFATSHWLGDATGTCGTNPTTYILEDWDGWLVTTGNERFDGFWGNDSLNDMIGPAAENGSVWTVSDNTSEWNCNGIDNCDYDGTWAGAFNESTGDMSGEWYSDYTQCTEGDLSGDKQ